MVNNYFKMVHFVNLTIKYETLEVRSDAVCHRVSIGFDPAEPSDHNRNKLGPLFPIEARIGAVEFTLALLTGKQTANYLKNFLIILMKLSILK